MMIPDLYEEVQESTPKTVELCLDKNQSILLEVFCVQCSRKRPMNEKKIL